MITEGSSPSIALLITVAAGLSTCIGGVIIFFKKLVYLANASVLSTACGASAGVMIFISLVEIFKESVESFEKGLSGNDTTNRFLECLAGNLTSTHVKRCLDEKEEACSGLCPGHSQLLATVCFIMGAALIFIIDFIVHKISDDADHDLAKDELNALHHSQCHMNSHPEADLMAIKTSLDKTKDLDDKLRRRKLNHTGVLTAVAIAIHNLPEGIATYIAARAKTILGLELAVGIFLHNIPEGIAVAAPVYFATESRFKAFFWTVLSALAEPLGGLICLMMEKFSGQEEMNSIAKGIMFGLVVGMMVTISMKELVPTAQRFSSSGHALTYSILCGMGVMALSLILFAYAGV